MVGWSVVQWLLKETIVDTFKIKRSRLFLPHKMRRSLAHLRREDSVSNRKIRVRYGRYESDPGRKKL